MKTPRKIHMAFGMALAALLCHTSQGATVVADTTEPGAGPLTLSTYGSYTRIFSANNNFGHSRGQSFVTADSGAGSGWEVSELALRAQANQTFGTGDTIKLWLFEWDPSDDATYMTNWVTGDGIYDDGDPLDGTTMGAVLIDGAIYDMPASVSSGDYLHFPFDTPLSLEGSTAYGVFFQFLDADDGTEGAAYMQVGIGSGTSTYAEGNQLRTIPSPSSNTYHEQDLTLYLTGSSDAAFSVGSPFQDGMILQRDKAITVWGWADAGTEMTVEIGGNAVSTTTDSGGNWSVELPALSYVAGTSYDLVISGAGQTLTIGDVLVGDVWITFGQSNMVQDLNALDNGDFYINEITTNALPIRCLWVDQDAALTPQETGDMTWYDYSDSPGDWTSVGTMFAYQNYLKTGVPNAIIWAAWGSSSIEGWMPAGMTNDFTHFAEMMDVYQSIGEYNSGDTVADRTTSAGYASNLEYISALINGEASWTSDADIFMRTRPNVIYNQMIHPLLKYDISGFVWYQGEANAGTAKNADQYGETLPAFVTEYRNLFNEGDLLFLGVQLPSYSSTYWPWFRESQDQLSTLNNAYVAVTIDTGLSGNIHPQDKDPISERLSLLAQKYELGYDVVAHGPTVSSVTYDDYFAYITFDNAAGLTTDDGFNPDGFEVAAADGIFSDASISSIDGTTVKVSALNVDYPVAVRYAWTGYAKDSINLVNGAGLPAAPFRTDTQWADAAPAFTADPFSATAAEVGVEYSASIASAASGSGLVFSNLTTGTWLTIAEDGTLSGTPATGNVGSNSFTVEVTDEIGRKASATMTIEVTEYVAPDLSKYVDTFDGDGIDVNTGSGDGLVQVNPSDTYALSVTDTNTALVFARGTSNNAGAERSAAVTANKFAVNNGFTLDVVYNIEKIATTQSDTGSFGLIDRNDAAAVNGLFAQAGTLNGLGMSLTDRNGNQGLNELSYTEGDAAGVITSLSSAQTVTAGTMKTFSLTVEADGSYSYSIDGQAPTTGTTTLDLTKEYYFAAFCQRFTTVFSVESVSFVPTVVVSEVGDITMDLSGGGGTHAGFSWYAASGANYVLQSRDNLAVGGEEAWVTVTNVAGADAVITITEEMDMDAEFFRVKLAE